ncbi:hypothetical protein ACIQAA_24990 [Neobacillus sp. NPDC093182]|uniref:hypothetical protein n=1 Tax=Neobacillus sp. NPDC093182 TaxID=3364297 RepID=UPI0037FA4E83
MMLKTDVEKESRSLADKWKPLIDYLERNGKEQGNHGDGSDGLFWPDLPIMKP